MREHTSLPDVAVPPHLASDPPLSPVTRILVLLRSLDDAMLPHTSGQFAGSMFLLVVDPGKPYTPTNPSRLGVNRILYKTFPDSTEQTCNSLYYAYNCVLDH